MKKVTVAPSTMQELKALIISDYSNQRKNDKHSVGYAIHAIEHWNVKGMYPEAYTRAELVECLISLLDVPTNFKRIANFATYRTLYEAILIVPITETEEYNS